jgi:hypothetical protein
MMDEETFSALVRPITMPYRDPLDALRQRRRVLEDELDETTRQLHEEEERRRLPMLDSLRVASPCSAVWHDMVGDDRVRFCGSCAKNVYNLSAMRRDEAEQLLRQHEGKVCVRFYRRADGTVMTSDCSVGARRKRRRRIAAVAVAGAATATALAGFGGLATMGKPCATSGRQVAEMGEPTADPADHPPAIMGTAAVPTPARERPAPVGK